MGAVRSFTPDAYITADDFLKVVDLPFTFWGYTRAHVANNGSVSFHGNYVGNRLDGNLSSMAWDDLGWEYNWMTPLDPTVPSTEAERWFYGWPWVPWVTLAPFATDIPASTWDDIDNLQQVFYGTDTIGGKQAFLVTWKDVPIYSIAGNGGTQPRNTFQVVMYDDDTWEFNYDKIEWTTPYNWDTLLPTELGVTESTELWGHALAGHRMLPHSAYIAWTMTYQNATGTITIGDIVTDVYSNKSVVTGITGTSAAGTLELELIAQSPTPYESVPVHVASVMNEADYPNLMPNTNYSYDVTSNNGWSVDYADITAAYWSPLTADDHVVEEFDWSRTITYIPSTVPYDILAAQLDTVVDGGDDSIILKSNCGVPGRYSSLISLNLVPLISVDVDLSGELVTDLPVPEGTLDLDVDVYYAGPLPIEASLDLDVQAEATLGTDLPVFTWEEITVDIGLSATAFVFTTFYPVGSIDVPVTTSAFAAWGGSSPLATGDLDVVVDLRASYYVDRLIDDLNGIVGGYWNLMGRYATSYPAWGQMTNTYTSNFAGHAESARMDQAANVANTSVAHMHNINFLGGETRVGGFNYDYTVEVYVPTGYPHVTLEARAGYPSSSYFFPASYTPWPTLIDSATTTAFDTWQTLTVTLPATNDQRGGAIYLVSTNQTVASRWYMDNAKWRQYGTAFDTSRVESDPANPNDASSVYREYQGGQSTGWYSNLFPTGPSYGVPVNDIHAVADGPSGPSFDISTSPGSSYLNAGIVSIFNVQPWIGSTLSTKFGAWVWVPTGNPPVRAEYVYPVYYNSAGTQINIYYPVGIPGESTTNDQWEYIETDITYALHYSGNNLPASWYTALGYLAVTSTGQREQATRIWVDDLTVRSELMAASTPLGVTATSTDYPYPSTRYTALVPVDLTGTLTDLSPQAEGSIDVDVDMFMAVPYDELISGSMDIDVVADKALSLRQNYKSTLFPYNSSWSTYGFEANQYTYDYEGGDWDWTSNGTGSYHPEDDLYYQIGGWAPPDGGQGGSRRSLIAKFFRRNTTRYSYLERWTTEFRPGFDLVAHVWIHNTSLDPVYFTAFNAYGDVAPTYLNPILAQAQTTKTNEWEKILLTVPWNTVLVGQGAPYPDVISYGVYAVDPESRPIVYLDNFDAFLIKPEGSPYKVVSSL